MWQKDSMWCDIIVVQVSLFPVVFIDWRETKWENNSPVGYCWDIFEYFSCFTKLSFPCLENCKNMYVETWLMLTAFFFLAKYLLTLQFIKMLCWEMIFFSVATFCSFQELYLYTCFLIKLFIAPQKKNWPLTSVGSWHSHVLKIWSPVYPYIHQGMPMLRIGWNRYFE